MVFSNTERQARHRQRSRLARDYHDTLIVSVQQAIDMVEGAIMQERSYGTRSGDGSTAGALMAQQEAWVAKQKEQLALLKSEADSLYLPDGQ